MNQFKIPTQLYFGEESLNSLSTFNLSKVLIVCDPFMVTSGMVNKIEQVLTSSGVDYVLFSNVVPDPTVHVVAEGTKIAEEYAPESIIAFGGGSAIDTAKAIRKIYQENNQSTPVRLICIPTTSGTGSEVTSFSVIADPDIETKYALVSEDMIPDMAILDPIFTESVPSSITADTGFDVLTHCMEAYASIDATDFTDACAEKAMHMVWKFLMPAVINGSDKLAREKMHNASCLAGISFSEASLGICHSLAHALGAKFHIPHGRANALLLPHVIRFNSGLDLAEETEALDRYVEIAALLNIYAGTKKSTVRALISKLSQFIEHLGMPKTIEACGVSQEDYLEAIDEMVEKALEDRCTITNPRVPTKSDLEGIYKKLCKGGR